MLPTISMLPSKEDFRLLLRQRLAEMTEKNPRFSLRAFAKKLGISASVLSRVISGQRSLSLETATRLAQQLDLNMYPNGQNAHPVHFIEFESFKVIADWYHLPLLELIHTVGFKSDEKWIAKRLGLPVPIVQAALDRLEHLALIERKNGHIKHTKNAFIKTTDDVKDATAQKHHSQMLEKAQEALAYDLAEREFRALNLNFNRKDVTEAKKMIRDFYKKFNRRFSVKNGQEVYQMNLQFFKLTKEIV